MLEVRTEVKMSFQIFSSSILHRGVPWEMFYVKGPVYLFRQDELWRSMFSVYRNFKMQCLLNAATQLIYNVDSFVSIYINKVDMKLYTLWSSGS